jgi:transcription elongation factor Elf1
MCSSEYAVLLGTLGRVEWLRCRDCGIEYTVREVAVLKAEDVLEEWEAEARARRRADREAEHAELDAEERDLYSEIAEQDREDGDR